MLALNETAINKDDVVTANADNLLMAFAGTFSGTPADGLDEDRPDQIIEALRTGRCHDRVIAGGQIASNFNRAERNIRWRFD